MKSNHLIFLGCLALSPVLAHAQSATVEPPVGEDICLMSRLDLSKVTYFSYSGSEGATGVRADRNTYNEPILLKDTLYTSGVGTHAPSVAVVQLKGATRFVARFGIDDQAKEAPDHGIVDYVITLYKDKKSKVVKRGTIRRDDAATAAVDVEVAGYDYMKIDFQQGAQNWADQVCMANSYFIYKGSKPVMVAENEMYPDTSDGKIVHLPDVGVEGGEIIPLSSLQINKATCGWGTIQANRSIDRRPITLRDTVYTSGVGTHAASQIIVKLNGAATRFVTRVGVDDEVAPFSGRGTGNGVVDYRVSLKGEDGNEVVQAEGTLHAYDETTPYIDVDCNGWKYLILEVFTGEGGDAYDHVDWANAYFEYHEQNSTPPEIVSAEEISSKLACATTLFSQPGVRYMHRLRAVNPSAQLSVDQLPAGLTWNADRRLVEGVIEEEGVYHYNIKVELEGETAIEPVTLHVSSQLQQPVPLMGWLSWNVVEGDISEQVVKTTADAVVSKGLADAGYNYVVIDDLWHADQREAGTGKPLPDARKFPNGMKKVADYVHSKGLKFGIYSDAAEKTCAGRYGSYGYETIDANQYAEWEVDLLKYDYCFAPSDQKTAQLRYKAMGDALKASGRDILFYMCEWGTREPWKWGETTGATCWRCTLDTRDGWVGVNGGIGMVQSINGMKDLWAYSGPNRFNDADMMCVGIHGKGKSSNDFVQHAGMTQEEYQTQFSLWCMWSSPLTLSFDLRKPISKQDMEIITNEELIALDQDRMGQQAELVSDKNGFVVFAKDLENGDVAISVTNMYNSKRNYEFDFSQIPALQSEATYQVRDLWQKKDMGNFSRSYATTVPVHGTRVYRLAKTPTGIENVTMDEIQVKKQMGAITVSAPGTEGLAKRVLVSDRVGRVVASGTTSATDLKLSLPAGGGTYVVNVICGGQSKSLKVVL